MYMIMSYDMHEALPPVVALAVHCKDMQYVQFDSNKGREAIAQTLRDNEVTTLTAWFELNKLETNKVWTKMKATMTAAALKVGPRARDLLYPDVPSCYIYKEKRWVWRKRLMEWPTIGRIYSVNPKDTERYMLRRL